MKHPYLTTNRLIAVLDELERTKEVLTQLQRFKKPNERAVLKARVSRIEDLLSAFGALLEAKGEA